MTLSSKVAHMHSRRRTSPRKCIQTEKSNVNKVDRVYALAQLESCATRVPRSGLSVTERSALSDQLLCAQ